MMGQKCWGKFFLFFTFCQVAFAKDCGVRGIDKPGTTRRVSTVGDSLSHIQEWPWMVSITKDTSSGIENHCSGTVINKKFVLTAAHCFDHINTNSLGLLFGSDDIKDEDQYYRVERDIRRTFIHPKYDKRYHYFDLALIEVENELEYSGGIQPICLPEKAVLDVDSRQNEGVTLTGYGKESREDSGNSRLRFAQLNIYAQKFCNESYTTGGRLAESIERDLPRKFQSNLLCAGYRITGEGSCKGDSGGPLTTYQTGGDEPFYEQVAIVSGGFGSCGNTVFPGIYVRLEDYQVLRWIYRVAFGRRLARPAKPAKPTPTGSHSKIYFPTTASPPRPKPQGNKPFFENGPRGAEFPWLVSIRGRLNGDDDTHFCYGTIIHQWQFITAASCMLGGAKTHIVAVDGLQVRRISSFKVHEDHSTEGRIVNDIAMVTLEDPLDFNNPNVQPISSDLLKQTESNLPNTHCRTIGCSRYSLSNTTYASQIVDSQIVSDETCRNTFENFGVSITPGMLCASKRCVTLRNNRPCTGDSGSPLVCLDASGRSKMVGLVSFGMSNCSRNPVIVFTRIAYYQDWISTWNMEHVYAIFHE